MPFALTVVHVDVFAATAAAAPWLSNDSLDAYRRQYPRFMFRRVPLAAALALPGIDWSALPPPSPTTPDDERAYTDTDAADEFRLRGLFDRLPSAASRADVARLLIRHVLLGTARDDGFQAVLLGHSTTALAELTLAEAAKGRGFSVPWQVRDGPQPDGAGDVVVHHPLRDVLRKELVTYATLAPSPPSPPLAELFPNIAAAAATTITSSSSSAPTTEAVVSHKHLSIDEVMSRYFAEVEANYPSVVANVARTTAKLLRGTDGREAGGRRCGVCSMPLDEQGDQRWRGELGIDEPERKTEMHLCYGCERSIGG